MLNNKKIYSMLLIAAIIIPMSLYGQPPARIGAPAMQGNKEPDGHGMMIPDLTEKQKEQMKELHIKHMQAVQPIKNQIGELEAKLHTLQTADDPNMNDINKLIETIGSKHTEIMKLHAAQRQEIRKLLTDEQRVVFDAQKHDHGQKFMHHPEQKAQNKNR
jgi:Spy/CpxP family protein refolding chaperone